MRDIIFISLENWDEIWRRNQFLCSHLAKRYPQQKILFVGLPINISHALTSGNWGEFFPPVKDFNPEGLLNVTVTRPIKPLPSSWDWGQKVNQQIFKKHILKKSHEYGLRDPILWINAYQSGHLIGKLEESSVIYDITDDWPLAESLNAQKEKIQKQDRFLCEHADLVLCCSEALLQSRQGLNKRVAYLPNGVDAEVYFKVDSKKKEEKHRISPVFGYMGTLHSDRLDIKLILSLSFEFPNATILLVGPNFLDKPSIELLSRQSNIQIVGPIPYTQVPERLLEFDVCLLPHQENPFTESLNPLKLWEYLASGKPIVSTNVAGFRDFPDLCYLASGSDAFNAACYAALAEGPEKREKRIQVALANSWEVRIDQLTTLMQPLFDK